MKKVFCLATLVLMFFTNELRAKDQVKVSEPWSRPAQIGQNGAVFLKMTEADDKLIKAECAECDSVELHTHLTELKKDDQGNDIEVKSMRPVPYIEVFKTGTTELKKGGLHIMLMKMKKELKVGDEIKIKLIFESSDPVEVAAKVKKCCSEECHSKSNKK